MQVHLAQQLASPLTTVLISNLPKNIVMAIPEVVVAILLISQATMFAASQLKGIIVLILYRASARIQTAAEAKQQSV